LKRGDVIVTKSASCVRSYVLLKGGKKLPILGLIRHVVYKRSCEKKSNAFIVKLRAFNVSLGSNSEQIIVEEEGLHFSSPSSKDLQLLYSFVFYIKKISAENEGW